MDFKTKDDLVNYIKTKKDNLEKHLDLSGFGRKKRITKKGKTFIKEAKELESKLKKYEELVLSNAWRNYVLENPVFRNFEFSELYSLCKSFVAKHWRYKLCKSLSFSALFSIPFKAFC